MNWYWSWWKDKPLFSYQDFFQVFESIQVWMWSFALREWKTESEHSLLKKYPKRINIYFYCKYFYYLGTDKLFILYLFVLFLS